MLCWDARLPHLAASADTTYAGFRARVHTAYLYNDDIFPARHATIFTVGVQAA